MNGQQFQHHLECVAIYPKIYLPKENFYIYQSYKFWKEIWGNTFSELDKTVQLFSNDFLYQDEIITLFYHDRPIGQIMFTWFDVECPFYADHSYIKKYSSEVLCDLLKINDKQRSKHPQKYFSSASMFMNSLAISKVYRKSANLINISLSQVLIGFAIERFLESDSPTLTSFTRNDRNIHHVVYNFGGITLSRGYIHDIPSDFITITKDTVLHQNLPHKELTATLWNNKHPIIPESIHKDVVHNKYWMAM